jgi:glucose-6-phosphate isomerase
MKININGVENFIAGKEIFNQKTLAESANVLLHSGKGKGNDFLGWIDLPFQISDDLINDIENTVNELKHKVEVVVTIGIGGSYLGSKAVIEALSDNFSWLKSSGPGKQTVMLFAGQNLSEDYLFELKELLKNKDYALIVISKSGTTTEPAVAFRILKKELEEKYGKKEAGKRIIAITDKEKGALRELAIMEGYKTYTIPDDVGGRFSVLTPVGLVPIAFAGYDIRKLVKGAKEMAIQTSDEVKFEENPAEQYALTRNKLLQNAYFIELLVNFNPKLNYFAEWWKQLFGESEGKDGKGIFPASVSFTTDLHSMGQYIQDGKRCIFETVISVDSPMHTVVLETVEENLDKLNFLADKRIEEINKSAEKGTIQAHIDGKVPIIRISIPELNEYHLGQMIYFFEKACGISGYILDVNPFDQPGVEEYKKNMFKILKKPTT